MTTMTISADTLIKSILATKDKGGLAATIARVTAGNAIGAGVVAKVEADLKSRFVPAPTDNESNAEKAKRTSRERMVADIVATLKAAPVLPVVLKEAEALFPVNGQARKGNKASAIRAGINAYVEKPERNDLASVMADAVPVLAEADARAKELASIRDAIAALVTRCGKAGVSADVVKQLTNLSAVIK